MVSVGDTIIYGGHGVCKIDGIREMTVTDETFPYYVLKPVFEPALTIYIKVGNEQCESKMRRVLSAEEIRSLIEQMPDEGTIWEPEENERKKRYKEILDGSDRVALVKLIKTLYLRGEELKASGKGKKLHASDERFLKDAEKTLYDEFAHVLDIKRDEVLPFICRQIEVAIKSAEGGSGE